jgi:phage major head subunit gpT-like protein
MPLVRGAWAELLAPGLNMRTFDSYREYPEFYRQINNVKNSRRAYEDDYRLAGLGPLARKGELETTILDEPIKIGGTRYIHKTFALGIAVSKEMRDDNQYDAALQLAAMLGQSSRYTIELYGHDVINNGFTTAKYTGRDGKALFATDHPIQGTGATASNTPGVNLSLSEAGIEAALGSFDAQVN